MKAGNILTKREDVVANAVIAAADVAGATPKEVWAAVEKRQLRGQSVTPAEMELIMAVEAAVKAQEALIEQATARLSVRAAALAEQKLKEGEKAHGDQSVADIN